MARKKSKVSNLKIFSVGNTIHTPVDPASGFVLAEVHGEGWDRRASDNKMNEQTASRVTIKGGGNTNKQANDASKIHQLSIVSTPNCCKEVTYIYI
jgi:hypothetical protein